MVVAADAAPDGSTVRVQVLLAARGGCRSALRDAVRTVADEVMTGLGPSARVMVLTQIEEDPFPGANPLCRPFDVVLEVQAAASVGVAALVGSLADLAGRLDELVHRDLSAVAVGTVQDLLPCAPSPLRYLYVMRRRAGSTHEQYVDHYFHSHSSFGFRTPNIEGYTQFHIDAEPTTGAAAVIGFTPSGADSVSELHIGSLDEFFAGIGDGRLGAEAMADEETFVDRNNSVSFCTTTEVVGR